MVLSSRQKTTAHLPRTSAIDRGELRSLLWRFGPALLYLLGAALLWRYFNFIFYKDELSYLSAAARYARGDPNAVNSYWAPLLSIELAPLLAAGASPELSTDIAKILNGLVALEGGRALVRALEARGWLATALDVVLVVVTLYCAMPFMSADLLLAGVLSWYLAVVLRRDYPLRPAAGLMAGALGGLAYYAKAYALFFVVAHIAILTLVHHLLGDARARAGALRHLRSAAVVIVALVCVWVAALYVKYRVVTLGIVGIYNYQIVGPEAIDRPILQIGFDGEPRPGNTSVWEDPADFYAIPSALACCLKPWSPLSSPHAFRHQLGLIKSNLATTLEDLQTFSSLAFGVIVLGGLLCVGTRDDVRRHLPMAFALCTVVLYPAGYLLVFSDERYLWPVLYLLIAMSGYLLSVGFATPFLASTTRRVVVTTLIAASFVKVPVSKLLAARDVGRSTSEFVKALRGTDLRGRRIASSSDFGASDIVAYHLSAKYIGVRRPNISERELRDALRKARIDYYFVWGGVDEDSAPDGFVRVKDVRIADNPTGQTRLTILRPL